MLSLQYEGFVVKFVMPQTVALVCDGGFMHVGFGVCVLSCQNDFVQCSTQDEPLGRSRLRGHKIPEHLGTIRAFGILSGAKVSCFFQ